MKRFLSIITILMILILSGCSGNDDYGLDIPNLKITYDEEKIEVVRGGFQWEGVSTKTASPDEIAKDMDGNKVLPEGGLNLEFSEKPDEVKVYLWEDSESISYEGLIDNTLTVPTEEGVYVFSIDGFWENGDVSYIIKIIVGES